MFHGSSRTLTLTSLSGPTGTPASLLSCQQSLGQLGPCCLTASSLQFLSILTLAADPGTWVPKDTVPSAHLREYHTWLPALGCQPWAVHQAPWGHERELSAENWVHLCSLAKFTRTFPDLVSLDLHVNNCDSYAHYPLRRGSALVFLFFRNRENEVPSADPNHSHSVSGNPSLDLVFSLIP